MPPGADLGTALICGALAAAFFVPEKLMDAAEWLWRRRRVQRGGTGSQPQPPGSASGSSARPLVPLSAEVAGYVERIESRP